MTRTADAVVIGGGINGCSIAYHLKKRGLQSVILLEKRHIASGPTGRSSGIVRQHYTLEPLATMARDSLQVFQDFSEQVGGSAGFVQTGAVFLSSERLAPALRETVEMQQRLKIRAEVLTPDELHDMAPALAHEDVACAAYEPDAGYADPALAANSYAEAAKQAGVELRQRTTVTDLRIDRGRISGVDTDRGLFSTGTVINVAGPWGGEIAAMAGARIPILPSRHPVVLFQRPPQWRVQTPICIDLINGAYFKPEGKTGLVAGSIKAEDGEVRADVDSYAEIPSYDEVAAFSEAALKRYPVMAEGRAQGGWAGLYDGTPDWQPVIDRVPEVEGFFCAAGFSGHGFKLAPAVGTIVSDLVLAGECLRYDISVFRYDRFQSGELSSGKYEFSIIG